MNKSNIPLKLQVWNTAIQAKRTKVYWTNIQEKFKRRRAYGECLGIGSRRRTWQAAKSCGELQISIEPQMSECGNTCNEELQNVYWINRYAWGTRGTETSKYPEEKKSNEILRVAASESGRGQTGCSNMTGVRTVKISRKLTEAHGKAHRRVWETRRWKRKGKDGIRSKYGHEESVPNMGGPSSKPKYYPMTDSGEVPWGKGEKNRGSGVKRTWNHMFTST